MAQQKPHVCSALVQLRRSVTLAGGALVLALVVQMLVFGFVHFTEARWSKPEQPSEPQTLSVVESNSVSVNTPRKTTTIELVMEAAEIRMLSRWDSVLRQFSNLAVSAGIISCAALLMFCSLGVVIAGGANVPGVEKAVGALMWVTILAAMCLPIEVLINTLPIHSVFSNYDTIIQMSDDVEAGREPGTSLVAEQLIAPIVGIVLAVISVFRFHAGVEAGTIATSVSDFDKAIEEEIARINKQGVRVSGGKAVGALNSALGDTPPSPPPVEEPPRMAAGAESASRGVGFMSPHDRRLSDPDPGDRLKRPI